MSCRLSCEGKGDFAASDAEIAVNSDAGFLIK